MMIILKVWRDSEENGYNLISLNIVMLGSIRKYAHYLNNSKFFADCNDNVEYGFKIYYNQIKQITRSLS